MIEINNERENIDNIDNMIDGHLLGYYKKDPKKSKKGVWKTVFTNVVL